MRKEDIEVFRKPIVRYAVEVESDCRLAPFASFATVEEAIEFANTVDSETVLVSKVEITTLWIK